MDGTTGQVGLRILMLEDMPADAELTEHALREAGLSFTVRRVDNREAFVRELAAFKPDLVLADYHLPAFDGGSAVRIVQQQYPDIPVVMVTGAVGDETAIELLRLGARDYILKDRLARLGSAVRRILFEEQGVRARKAAEEALRQSEAELRMLVEYSPVAMLVNSVMNDDKSIMMMNQKFGELFGYVMEDVPDIDCWWMLAIPDEKERECFHAQWNSQVEHAVLNHGRIEPMETSVTCKDGSKRYVKVSLSSIGSKNIMTFEDLTERKKAEERLRFSEALLRQTQSMTSVGSWRLYISSRSLVWSDETYHIFGLPLGTPLNYDVFVSLIHPDDREMVSSAWRAALGGVPYRVQHRIVVDGATRWVEECAEFEFDSLGNPYACTGAVQDVTERRQAEAKIQGQAKLLDLILDNSQDSIVLLDKDYNFVRVSASYAKSCQRAISEFDGHNHFEFYPSSLKEEFDHALQNNLIYSKAGRPFIFPDHPEWGVTYWDIGMVPIRDARNEIELLLFSLRDVTKRKEAEARVQKLTRLYATLSQINEIIVRTTNRADLFNGICEGAVTQGRFLLAWVGLVDEATHMIRPVCHYGANHSYLDNIFISSSDVPEGHGPTGTAIRENCVSHVNDYSSDKRALPWREMALKYGFNSVAGVPLRFRNKVIGALTLYAGERDFFDAEQLSLLEEMATDISFALDGFEREALRQQAEDERSRALQKLRRALEGSIQVAASISEVRDPYTAGHQQRVSLLAVEIAREIGLEEDQIDGIRFGALIHDIGKIGVPVEILSKSSKLTLIEKQLIRQHADAGYEIVKDIEFPWPVAQMIQQHHERLDGSGYPQGLRGDEILLGACIISVADVVEAISSHRPYRPGFGIEAALEEITRARGTQYDPRVVDICVALFRERGYVIPI